MKGSWYNFRTGESEEVSEMTDENALDYLPQDDSAAMLYATCREMGESVLEAMVYVLRAYLGGIEQ